MRLTQAIENSLIAELTDKRHSREKGCICLYVML